jgi:hypothetical protein
MPRRRRPRPPPDLGALYPTLDLHGETADSARRKAEAWLRRQREAGERHVRLITGRGNRSVGPPVLRAEVETLLRELAGELVARSAVETGGGALRVELRPPSPLPARPAAPPVRADPALRRAAEEALAELGVHPTPELVEAELRRMRDARQGGAGD